MPQLAQNRRALHDYQILEKFEAGLVLTGAEVKSAKLGHISLQGSYVIPKGTELWLTGATISAYAPAKGSGEAYNPERDRKLLLKRNELSHILGNINGKGLTLVPILVYTAHRLIKIEIALARGKTKYDKRVTLRKRETDREIRRTLKR